MRVHVDKARRHHHVGSVDDRDGLSAAEVADHSNAIPAHADVGLVAWGLLPVDDGAVPDDEVEHEFIVHQSPVHCCIM